MTNKKSILILVGIAVLIALVIFVTRSGDESPDAGHEVASENNVVAPKVDPRTRENSRAKAQIAKLRANLQRDLNDSKDKNDSCPTGFQCMSDWDCGEKAPGGPHNCGGPLDRCCKEPTEECPGKCEAFLCPKGAKKIPGAFADCKFPGNCCESSGDCPGECAIGRCPEGTSYLAGAFDDCDLPHICCTSS